MVRWFSMRKIRNKFNMADVQWKSVINMTNGIMGVSILAMPYCFHQVISF